MASQRGTSAPSTRQMDQQQQQQSTSSRRRRRQHLPLSSPPASTPPTSPPSPSPSLPLLPQPSAGWQGRYPHLDAVRVSALAHRQSIDVPRPSGSSFSAAAGAATGATGAGGGDVGSFLFGAGKNPSSSLLVPHQGSSPPPVSPRAAATPPSAALPGGLSATEAASRASWATSPPRSSSAPPPPSQSSSSHAAASVLSPPASASAAAATATAVTPPHLSSLLPDSFSSRGGAPAAAPAAAAAPEEEAEEEAAGAPRCSRYPPDDPRGARAVLREAVAGLEAARARRGFFDSLLRDGPPQANERYTARLQALKKHARAAISLTPRTRRPSNVLADVIGMLVAAVAMAFATFTVYLAQRQGPQFGALYVMILVGGYVVKGKMDFSFPDFGERGGEGERERRVRRDREREEAKRTQQQQKNSKLSRSSQRVGQALPRPARGLPRDPALRSPRRGRRRPRRRRRPRLRACLCLRSEFA